MVVFIVSDANPSVGVRCYVIELQWTPDGKIAHLSGGKMCHDGCYTLDHPHQADALLIEPVDGHWHQISDIVGNGTVVTCQTILDDIDNPWWQRLVGYSPATSICEPEIRVGVIDRIGPEEATTSHIDFIDDDTYKSAIRTHKPTLHGVHVLKILSGKGPGGYKGAAADAKVFFVDATLSVQGQLMPGVSHVRVTDAIDRLSGEYNVNLINLSLGFDEARIESLEDAVEDAADRGVLCICAGGNKATVAPLLPARLASTVGVGGIGVCGIAPPGSVYQRREMNGVKNGFGAAIGAFGPMFHDPYVSIGLGINVAAPSVGVILRHDNANVIELHGTSYAAPIVTSVLACHISRDPGYRVLAGRKRYLYAMAKLESIAAKLGLDVSRVGRGLPLL